MRDKCTEELGLEMSELEASEKKIIYIFVLHSVTHENDEMGQDISRGKFIFLSSTRLSPPVTLFSEYAKFKNGEERRERAAKERFSQLLIFAHSLNGVKG